MTVRLSTVGTGDKRDTIEASSQGTGMIHPQTLGLSPFWVWHTSTRVGPALGSQRQISRRKKRKRIRVTLENPSNDPSASNLLTLCRILYVVDCMLSDSSILDRGALVLG